MGGVSVRAMLRTFTPCVAERGFLPLRNGCVPRCCSLTASSAFLVAHPSWVRQRPQTILPRTFSHRPHANRVSYEQPMLLPQL
jgi:hypothetical protein